MWSLEKLHLRRKKNHKNGKGRALRLCMLFNLPMDHELMPKCIYAPPLNSLRIICQNWVISAYQNILMRFNNLVKNFGTVIIWRSIQCYSIW
ncbi:hypothetical protein HanIR_Chr04g0207371 [Helianthus annuus]|nr:hypothetical protein HanIR_Chr04g0207371 [Helianthus annuus]